MGCLPESGGDERIYTEPFVHFLNNEFELAYSFINCPEEEDRNSPQPEVLYRDSINSNELVIERKCFIWPLEFTPQHKNDHFLGAELFRLIGPHTSNEPFEIKIAPAPRVKKSELRQFAKQIADEINPLISKLEPGQCIHSSKSNVIQWRFRRQREDERDFNEPETGLGIGWRAPAPYNLYDISQVPIGLLDHIQNGLSSTDRKFESYTDARRILLVSSHGELEHLPGSWWREILGVLELPKPVNEIWLANYGHVTELDWGWMFERITGSGRKPRNEPVIWIEN